MLVNFKVNCKSKRAGHTTCRSDNRWMSQLEVGGKRGNFRWEVSLAEKYWKKKRQNVTRNGSKMTSVKNYELIRCKMKHWVKIFSIIRGRESQEKHIFFISRENKRLF